MYVVLVCVQERESGLFEWSLCVIAAWHWLVFLGRWEGPAMPLRFSAAVGIFPRHFWWSFVSCGTTNGSMGPPTCLSWLGPGRSMWNPTQTLIKLYTHPDRHPHWNLRALSGHTLNLSNLPLAYTYHVCVKFGF